MQTGNMSNYLAKEVLKFVFRGEEFNPPDSLFLGLVSSSATEENLQQGDLSSEVVGYEGDRREIEFDSPVIIGNVAVVENKETILFSGMPTVPVKYGIVCDSQMPGTGNILYWLYLEEEVQTASGSVAHVDKGSVKLKLT